MASKQKKMEVFSMSITNRTPAEAAKEVENAMKAVQQFGHEKIDVKISVKAMKKVEPWDLV